jgi:tetratricopeptide (TPR) repeat protein/tRNA A-37 threonylcarbamoyl transferase component Bud32
MLLRAAAVRTACVPALAGMPAVTAGGSADSAGGEEPRQGGWPVVPGYEILGELGRGGMGVVYKARQHSLGRDVALKMVLAGSFAGETARARFRAEGQAVARLQHPHIVQVFEVGEHQGHPYLALEYVAGGSLASRLAGGPLPAEQAARLVAVLACAAHAAHEKGIVHRDLKPDNVLLDAGGQPKLTDFGLAKWMDDGGRLTHSDVALGTPLYMAPEQACHRQQDVGPRTDVWALGAILYECLTGQVPFRGQSPVDLLLKISREEPVAPSRLRRGVPRDLQTICLKCLHKEPQGRYAAAGELADDLRRFLEGEPIRARPVRPWERGLRWARRRPGAAALLASLALLLVFAAASWSAQDQRRRALRDHTAARMEEAFRLHREGRLAEAARLADDVQQTLDREPSLAGLRDAADELLREVRAATAAHTTLQRLREKLDEVRFLGGMAAGGPAHAAAVREQARQALALVGVSGGRVAPVNPSFPPGQRAELLRGRYELLLTLAAALARPAPGRPSADAAREGLGVLGLVLPATGLRTPAYHLCRARCLEDAGQNDEARLERQQAAALPAVSAFDHHLAAMAHFRDGQVAAAAAAFRRAVALDGHDFWARFYLAQCQLRQRQPGEARDSLTACIRQRPGVVYLYLLRGQANGQCVRPDEALRDLDEAGRLLERRPDREASYALHNNRAVVRIALGQYDLAAKDLRRALALQPRPLATRLSLAELYRRQGDAPGELRELDLALPDARALFAAGELDPLTLARVYRQRSQAHARRGRHDEALADLHSAHALEKPQGAARALAERERGRLLYQAGRYEAAAAAYATSLAAAPTSDAHLARGQALLRLRRYADAGRSFDAYFQGEKTPAQSAYRGRALARSEQGDPRGAAEDYTRALAWGDDPALRVLRGQAYLSCRSPRLAAADFEEALRRQPHNARARLGLGLARLQLGELRPAAADAEEALRLAPDDSRLAYDGACLLAQAAGQLGGGPGRTPADRDAARRWRERAGRLLQQALLLLPAGQRAPFWNGAARLDRSLTPIRTTDDFLLLERRYARRSTP